MIKYQYTKELLRSTALFLSLALISVDAMEESLPPTPIEISGKGRVRTVNINKGYQELQKRSNSGDLKAQQAIKDESGNKEEAIRKYNTLLSAAPSGSSAFQGGVYGSMPDYSKISREEMMRMTKESNERIQAQLDELYKKAFEGKLTFEEETKIMPYLEGQLNVALPDRVSYEEYKLKEQRERERRALAAQVQRDLQAEKDKGAKEAEDAKKAEYKEAYDRVRSQFKGLPLETQQKIASYYSSPRAKSTMWELLYLSDDEKDFNHDLPSSGSTYERQITLQASDLLVMNEDELHALAYLITFMENSLKRDFHLNRIRNKLSGNPAAESSIQRALRLMPDAPPKDGSPPQKGQDIPPPPKGGMAPPPKDMPQQQTKDDERRFPGGPGGLFDELLKKRRQVD